MTTDPLPIGISAGEPAGIGPDLCLQLAHQFPDAPLVIAADATLMRARARLLGLPYPFLEVDPWEGTLPRPRRPLLWHHPLAVPARAGHLEPRNSRAVLNALDSLTDACQAGHLAALVTAPLQKSVIVEAGIPFTGHTEYLAARLGVSHVVMMLVGGGLRVALATTHLPLSQVPSAITQEVLDKTLTLLHHELKFRFGCPSPRILVAGLNPHAGENGHLGQEEITVISPAIARAQAAGIDAQGPFPADTLFLPERLEGSDAVLVMYHDQGLPVLKRASFGSGVNITLGLPILRTSVDHGTALDRAGTGNLDPGSLQAALALARSLAQGTP
ncbi:MAG: 4-hydroxythreonine-4-phosphate dehydrogenase PdxA [Ferrovum myxofaciens]|uniref:4-hydroxythreonine-4-phosphate dehydrogenase PdxA n=1 Tax=Ferrovum myxofaciens TaxID=416213 RepID=UPI0023570EA9|nr:4-hydroxythreonine-4-phosphate dehydrogenase PdxA [Ferrovum myxofaciens]QKE41782.1 MAG: 4-hydroxythreonine-4-phosphate dehydrogenase PdxA [Ferrovum myxofaciens]